MGVISLSDFNFNTNTYKEPKQLDNTKSQKMLARQYNTNTDILRSPCSTFNLYSTQMEP